MEYSKLSKKALTCMYVKSLIWFIICTSVILLVNLLFCEEWPDVVSIILYIVICLHFLYILIAPKIRYERYRYRLTDEEFEVRKGLLVIHTAVIPIERLHKIEISAGPIFRAFGLKEVDVTTAGSDLKVSFLENEVADQIARHLTKRINAIVVEEKAYGEQ